MSEETKEAVTAEAPVEKHLKKKHPFRNGVLTGVAVTAAAAVVVSLVGLHAFGLFPADGPVSAKSLTKIHTLSRILDQDYYKDVSDSDKADGLYKGLMASAGDRYTEYYTPEEYRELMIDLTGDYAGIGALLSKDPDTGAVTIRKVYADSPAEKAGLKDGDVLISADGKDAASMELNDFVQIIRGKTGTDVSITYTRDGQETTVAVTREDIVLPSVDYQMLPGDPKIGYIEITQFSDGTLSEFEKALADLESQGMQGVIFDLRSNGGGLVDSVVSVLDDILPAGEVVYTLDKYNNRKGFDSDDEKKLDIPITVLVSGNTASAAEIFTGAIRDFDYGTVIGTKTFGKGIVQTTMQLYDGSAVKVTTSTYYTPKGTSINGKGIEPDIELEYEAPASGQTYDINQDNQVEKAEEVLASKIKEN